MPPKTNTSIPPQIGDGVTRGTTLAGSGVSGTIGGVKKENPRPGRQKDPRRNKGVLGPILDIPTKIGLPAEDKAGGSPVTGSRSVCASQYSGATCPPDGMGFAELSTNQGKPGCVGNTVGDCDFAALGDLKKGAKLKVTGPNGKTVELTKVDVGQGGDGCGGFPRAIDLCPQAAAALGINGLGVVEINSGLDVPAAIGGAVSGALGVLGALFRTDNLIKIGKVLAGALLVALAVMFASRELAGSTVGKVVKGAVKK